MFFLLIDWSLETLRVCKPSFTYHYMKNYSFICVSYVRRTATGILYGVNSCFMCHTFLLLSEHRKVICITYLACFSLSWIYLTSTRWHSLIQTWQVLRVCRMQWQQARLCWQQWMQRFTQHWYAWLQCRSRGKGLTNGRPSSHKLYPGISIICSYIW